MEITYLNHSSFLLKTKVNGEIVKIVFDPFDDSIGIKFKKTEADIVLISHLHQDHSNVGSVVGLENYDIKDESFGSLDGKPYVIHSAGEFEVKGVHIKGIKCFHDSKNGVERGENIIYVIQSEGLHVCHLGDLGHILSEEQVEQIGSVDLLLVPSGGVYTLSCEDAFEVVNQIEPGFVIPMHFKSPKHSEAFKDLQVLDDFLKVAGYHNGAPKDSFTVQKGGEETEVVVLSPKY